MGEVTLHDISKRFALRIDGALQTVQALSRQNMHLDKPQHRVQRAIDKRKENRG